MFEAEFTHVGDRCTFEVLVDRFALREPGLGAIAEIVHDIDVKDGKFGRAEAPGVATLIAGIALSPSERTSLGSRWASVCSMRFSRLFDAKEEAA